VDYGAIGFHILLLWAGFLLLGAVCRDPLFRRSPSSCWKWLAAFGFVHGANEWLHMLSLALVLDDSVFFSAIRFAVLITSYLCLLEFGRVSLLETGVKMASSRWVIARSCASPSSEPSTASRR